MRKIRDVLRLTHAMGMSRRLVGEATGIGRTAEIAGVGWPIPDEIDDAELKRRGVTLALLWQEYRTEHAQGFAYSWFCESDGGWRKRISPTMRQTHVAGEKLFVDWAVDTISVFDATTGEERRAHIFVAALGASN